MWQFFNLLNVSFNELYGVLGVFPMERAVFLRERDSGDYSVSAYYIGKQVAELPFQLLFPIVGGTIIYWMVGLQAVWYKFFTFLGLMSLVGMWATSMGFLLSAGTSVVAAGALGPSTLSPLLLVYVSLPVAPLCSPLYFLRSTVPRLFALCSFAGSVTLRCRSKNLPLQSSPL